VNIPNLISLFRIFCTPILIIVLLSHFHGKELIGLAIFLLANISDIVDGVWARRKNQITTLGLFLDPIADKLLMSSVLICLVGQGVIPSWIVIIFVGRDIAITGFRYLWAPPQ